MIIGDIAIIPEDVLFAEKVWLPGMGWKIDITRSNGTITTLYTIVEKEAFAWMKKLDKAIEVGAAARDDMRAALASSGYSEEE